MEVYRIFCFLLVFFDESLLNEILVITITIIKQLACNKENNCKKQLFKSSLVFCCYQMKRQINVKFKDGSFGVEYIFK